MSIWIITIQSAFSQPPVIPTGKDTLQFLLESLTSIAMNQKQLLTENKSLKYKIWFKDSIDYDNAYNTASSAVGKSESISDKVSFLHTCIIENLAFLAVAKSQNITNSDFPKVMADEAVKMLGTDKSPEKDTAKVRVWRDVVTRLANNPLLKGILSSNPVTSTVVSVVNFASTWFNQSIAGTKIENAKIELKQAITQQKLKGFVDRMQAYINFYDQLNGLTKDFETDMNNIQVKYKPLQDEIGPYDSQILTALKLKSKNDSKVIPLNALFRLKETPEFGLEISQDFYRQVLDDNRVKSFIVLASKWELYQKQVNAFEKEYRTAVVSFFTRYYTVLNVTSMQSGTTQPLPILDITGLNAINASLLTAINVNKIRLEEIKGN
jgi:hypothetical protein